MKSGNLNFLEPSGPLQAGNGTALLFREAWWDRWDWREIKGECFIFVGNTEWMTDHLGDLVVDGKIILQCIQINEMSVCEKD
jgi:hypothetical protein